MPGKNANSTKAMSVRARRAPRVCGLSKFPIQSGSSTPLRSAWAGHPLLRSLLIGLLQQPTLLKSKVADMNNVSEGGFGGAITAALSLQSFVNDPSRWVHIDSYGWNDRDRPGRPAGGDGLAMRALFAMISDRFNSLLAGSSVT